MKTVFYCLLFSLFSSCAFHNGMVGGGIPPANPACIRVGTAHGSSKTGQVLGIGGTRRDALVLDAKEDMYQNYPLDPQQQYAFITVDFKRSFFPFFSSTQVVISADILDCSGEAEVLRSTSAPVIKAYPGGQLEPGKTVSTLNSRFKILSLDLYGFKARRIDQPYFSTKSLPYTALKSPVSVNPVRLQGKIYILAAGDTIRYQSEGKVQQAVVTGPSNLYVRPLEVEEGRQFIIKPEDIIVPEE